MYTASVANNVTSVTVTGTASDANASVSITLAGDTMGTDQSNGREVDLDVGDTEITAMVVSEDASDTTSYMVTVTRAQAVVTLSAPASMDEGGDATINAMVDHAQDSAFTVTVSATGGDHPSHSQHADVCGRRHDEHRWCDRYGSQQRCAERPGPDRNGQGDHH